MKSFNFKQVPFIAVEGPIGVGKSSLAKFISELYNYQLLNEIVEENPFLGKFYDNISEWAFQTEMFFLSNRYKQLEDIGEKYLKQQKAVVSDYHIFKNMIFAQRTLNKEQQDKYTQIYDILVKDKPQPNLIIYLNADLETIIKRINMRGRDIEKSISPSYLQQLSADYENFIKTFKANHPEIPVIEFYEVDFIFNKIDLNNIIEQINHYIS
jgi:deoxyguanosine kinase